MAHKVFICHSSQNKPIADAACAALEAQRIPCWIAPRDILGGEEWGEAIINALSECQVVLLIFSLHANNSPQVRREIERAVHKQKIIVPFRIEDVMPSRAMEYALGNTHWLDAITPPMERRLAELCATIASLLQRKEGVEPGAEPGVAAGGAAVQDSVPIRVPSEATAGSGRSRGLVLGVTGALVAGAALATGVALYFQHGSKAAVSPQPGKIEAIPISTPQAPPPSKPQTRIAGQISPPQRTPNPVPPQSPRSGQLVARNDVANPPGVPAKAAPPTPAPVTPPAVVAAPVAVGPPPLSAEDKARLDRVEAQIDDLEGSVPGVNSSLNAMAQTMQKQGVTINSKWTELQSGMNTNLKKAREALNKQDADHAERYAATAGSDMGQIKTFLGR